MRFSVNLRLCAGGHGRIATFDAVLLISWGCSEAFAAKTLNTATVLEIAQEHYTGAENGAASYVPCVEITHPSEDCPGVRVLQFGEVQPLGALKRPKSV